MTVTEQEIRDSLTVSMREVHSYLYDYTEYICVVETSLIPDLQFVGRSTDMGVKDRLVDSSIITIKERLEAKR